MYRNKKTDLHLSRLIITEIQTTNRLYSVCVADFDSIQEWEGIQIAGKV